MNPSGPVVTAFIDFLLHPPETSDSDIAIDNDIDRIMPTVKRECMNAGVDWDSFDLMCGLILKYRKALMELQMRRLGLDSDPSYHIHLPKSDKSPFPFMVKSIPSQSDRKHITADILMNNTYPDTIWYVDSLFCQGMGFLAGDPKVGKSLLILYALYCIATGKMFLGRETRQAVCIYYSLENKEQQDHERLIRMFEDSEPGSENLHFYRQMPGFSEGLLETIESDISRLKAKVLVIDTYGQVSKDKKPGTPEYEQVVKELGKLRRLTDDNDICLILVTHTSKNAINLVDPMDGIMGSRANRGGSDFNIVLLKDHNVPGRYLLRNEGRSGAELELVLSRDASLRFQCEGTSDELRSLAQRTAYESNPLRNTIASLLMSQATTMVTAAEILDLLPSSALADYESSDKVGRAIRRLAPDLYTMDKISVSYKRDEKRRLIVFTRPKLWFCQPQSIEVSGNDTTNMCQDDTNSSPFD